MEKTWPAGSRIDRKDVSRVQGEWDIKGPALALRGMDHQVPRIVPPERGLVWAAQPHKAGISIILTLLRCISSNLLSASVLAEPEDDPTAGLSPRDASPPLPLP